jgi:N-acyl-D-amino-acid deacylase
VDDALAAGLDMTFDTYPYLRSNTIITMIALGRWVDGTDLDAETARLSDPAIRREVVAGLDPTLGERLTFAHVPHPDWAWVQGRTLTAAAAEAGRDEGELLLDVVVATGLVASAVVAAPPSRTEDSVRRLLRHDHHMGGSDGILLGGHPHPRGWGAFARFLRRHVRELGDWTWPQAAHHLSAGPARRFGLTDRGRIAVGYAADLAVIDPDQVADTAGYDRPRELAVGVADVVVNGVVVLRDSTLTGQLPGTPLHPYPGR